MLAVRQPICISNSAPTFVVLFNNSCRSSDLFVYRAERGTTDIGEGTTFEGGVRLLQHEPGRILIGKDCMLADQIDITISDMHSMVTEGGQRTNPPPPLYSEITSGLG